MSICPKCGKEKIRVQQQFTERPGYHVRGSQQEYCGYCDKPPITTLTVGKGAYILDPD